MAGSGQTSIKFNDAFFDQILNSAGVRALTRGAAEKALGVAKANARIREPTATDCRSRPCNARTAPPS